MEVRRSAATVISRAQFRKSRAGKMSERIALDLKVYNTSQKLSNLPSDTASLAIEASNDPNIPRVNVHYFVKKNNEKVIIPGRDKRDVLEMYDPSDLSTKAGIDIRDQLLNDEENDGYVWISPSGPWPETRIEVGAKKITKSGKYEFIKAYGISTTLSQEGSLKLGQLLVSISNDNQAYPEVIDDLRMLVIKFKSPEFKDFFEYIAQFINLPEKNLLQNILNGKADKIKASAVKAAVIATAPIRSNPNVIYTNPIAYGGYIENQMAKSGFEMSPKKFGCGISNNEVRTNNIYMYSNSTETPQYVSTITGSDSKGPLSFTCHHCGGLNTRIPEQLIKYCQCCGGDVSC